MKWNVLILLLFLTFSGYASDQSRADSLEQRLEKGGDLGIREQIKIERELVKLFAFSDYKKCLSHSRNLLRLGNAANNAMAKADAYRYTGMTYKNLGDKEKALENYMLSKDILESGNNSGELIVLYKEIAMLLVNSKEDNAADTYFNKAVELARSSKSYEEELAEALSGYANYCMVKESYKKARELYDEAIRISKKNGDAHTLIASYSNGAQAYLELGASARAFELLDSALYLAQDHGRPLTIGEILQVYGEARMQNSEYSLALNRLEGVRQYYDSIAKDRLYVRNIKYRAICHGKLGQSNIALPLMIEYVALSDSMHTVKSNDEYEKYQIIYDTQEKEREIKEKKQRIAFLEKKQEANTYRITLFLSLAVILALVIVVFYYRSKARIHKLNTQISQRESEMTNYAMELLEKNKMLKNAAETMRNIRREVDTVEERLNTAIIADQNIEMNERLLKLEQRFYLELSERFPELTAKERKICGLIKLEHSSKEIAEMIQITPRTVDNYRHKIRRKLNLKGDESLVKFLTSI